VAVIGSFPVGRVEVEIVVIPLVNGDVPRTVVPLVKVTVPVTPEGSEAVKVTDWFAADGLVEEVRVTVGVALVTIWVVVPVAGLLLASPP
jgi:hypothetical protein